MWHARTAPPKWSLFCRLLLLHSLHLLPLCHHHHQFSSANTSPLHGTHLITFYLLFLLHLTLRVISHQQPSPKKFCLFFYSFFLSFLYFLYSLSLGNSNLSLNNTCMQIIFLITFLNVSSPQYQVPQIQLCY